MHKKRLFSSGLLILVSFIFSGCVNNLTVKKVESDPVSERLIEASDAAASSLKVLARVNNAKSFRTLSKSQISQNIWQNSNVPFNMGKKIDIDKWSGPAESILRNLAEVSNYRFRVTGYAPIPAILLHVSGNDKMIIDYIYDIGYQLGDRADVVIYPPENGNMGIIDLRYLHKLNN